jgi:hypothetical protein
MTRSRRVGSCESTERPLNQHFLDIGLAFLGCHINESFPVNLTRFRFC